MSNSRPETNERDGSAAPERSLTPRNLWDGREAFFESAHVFAANWEVLVRSYLAPYFPEKHAFRASLPDIVDALAGAKCISPDFCVDKKEPWQALGRLLLDLEQLPADARARIYEEASDDFAEILANLRKCDDALEAIARRDPKTESDNQDARFYEHYRQLNLDVRDRIVDVLAHEIRFAAIRECSAIWPRAVLFWSRRPWIFRVNRDAYDPNAFSEIDNKLGDLPIDEFQEMRELARNDGTEFSRRFREHIERLRPVERVLELLNEHHRLFERRDVIAAALDAYAREQYRVFSTLVAVQIEGLFEDLCREMGVAEKTLRVAAIVPKLDALRERGHFLPDYAYYAFRFPKVRNAIAHGRSAPDDWQSATFLLLDLLDVARMLVQSNTPLRRLIELARRAQNGTVSPADSLRFAVLLAAETSEVPAFYGVDEGLRRIRESLSDNAPWDFARELLAHRWPEVDSALRHIARQLKRQGIATASCTALLRELGDRGQAEFSLERFWSLIG